MNHTVIVNEGGEGEHAIDLDRTVNPVPDLWHVSQYLKENGNLPAATMVLEAWYMAHAMVDHIKQS